MKKLILIVLSVICAAVANAAGKKAHDSLDSAIEAARKENKLIFIKYGREACGNCRNLGKLLKAKKVKVFDSEFVVADLDCDADDDRKAFYGKYRAAFAQAKTLPFVVVAQADGTLVASMSSYQDAEKYNKFILDAKKKAKKT